MKKGSHAPESAKSDHKLQKPREKSSTVPRNQTESSKGYKALNTESYVSPDSACVSVCIEGQSMVQAYEKVPAYVSAMLNLMMNILPKNETPQIAVLCDKRTVPV